MFLPILADDLEAQFGGNRTPHEIEQNLHSLFRRQHAPARRFLKTAPPLVRKCFLPLISCYLSLSAAISTNLSTLARPP
jgi:hypothetical protein